MLKLELKEDNSIYYKNANILDVGIFVLFIPLNYYYYLLLEYYT